MRWKPAVKRLPQLASVDKPAAETVPKSGRLAGRNLRRRRGVAPALGAIPALQGERDEVVVRHLPTT